MKRLILISILGIALILSSFVVFPAAQAEQSNEDDINFVFYAPGLKDGRFLWFSKEWGYTSYGLWLTSAPYAWVIHVVSGGGFTWDGNENVEKALDWINASDEQITAANFGEEKFVRNGLGSVEYKTFDGADPTNRDPRPMSCIVFSQFYSGYNRLFGVYCDAKPLTPEIISAALKGLGSKVEGFLPPKPGTPTY